MFNNTVNMTKHKNVNIFMILACKTEKDNIKLHVTPEYVNKSI